MFPMGVAYGALETAYMFGPVSAISISSALTVATSWRALSAREKASTNSMSLDAMRGPRGLACATQAVRARRRVTAAKFPKNL